MPICQWALGGPELRAYHDFEWGRAAHDDRTLVEFRGIETAYAGLSWTTNQRERGGYRRAFAGFDPEGEVVDHGGIALVLAQVAGLEPKLGHGRIVSQAPPDQPVAYHYWFHDSW